jgi:Sec-independent protein translocase protein TatA
VLAVPENHAHEGELFGGAKLPQLARSLGQARTEFERGRREGLRSDEPEPEAADQDETTDPPAPGAAAG